MGSVRPGQFAGQVAIVTGGGGSIGGATARLLAVRGARVVIGDLPDSRGQAVVDEIMARGGEAVFVPGDVSREDEVAALVKAALDRWRSLDVMVANAGIGGRGAADQVDLASWQRVLDVNLTSVFLCIRHAVPAMRVNGRGAIVITGSMMGLVAPRNAVPYAATKGAIVNLTRASAIDFAPDGIRVNGVAPGHLESPTSIGGAEARAADTRDLLSRYPLGRLGRPDDVARAIAFLASDEAAFITGTTLVVDGGYSAQ